ncbi:hypothetical protein [Cryobacterium aureum]|uniref:hypothetical protein n=1 Tax=Cryobacterium aureum TaxID=995037 RepID=UPI000CF497B1
MILDGIFNADRYAPLLARVRSMTDDARFYAFDLSFEETVLRHKARSQAVYVTANDMAVVTTDGKP